MDREIASSGCPRPAIVVRPRGNRCPALYGSVFATWTFGSPEGRVQDTTAVPLGDLSPHVGI